MKNQTEIELINLNKIIIKEGMDVSFSSYNSSNADMQLGGFSQSSDLKLFYSNFNPSNFEINWTIEFLHLYNVEDINQYQNGYKSKLWNNNWLVIGDCSGDPIIVSLETPSVYYSFHGRGCWDLIEISPNFCLFIKCLSKWIVCRNKFKSIRSENGIKEEFMGEFLGEISCFLESNYVSNWRKIISEF